MPGQARSGLPTPFELSWKQGKFSFTLDRGIDKPDCLIAKQRNSAMNIRFKLLLIMILMTAASACFGQDHEIRTLFNGPKNHGNGGYAGLANKFTSIRGEYANICEVYGGWYINHRFLIGVSAAAVTNNLPVPREYSTNPHMDMSYQYGQFGLMTEYTLWSERAVHLSFHVMNGAGFTLQYVRDPSYRNDYTDEFEDYP